MYFPYLRGRQYELLALRELVTNHCLDTTVVPIVEPVKLSPTLVNIMGDFIKESHPLAVIANPAVGSFQKDLENVQEGSKEASYKQRFIEQYSNEFIINSAIMQSDASAVISGWTSQGVSVSDMLIINTSRDYLDTYETCFQGQAPRYALIPDESAFRRKIRRNKVLLDDKFEKQERNSDYLKVTDEFFSDDHLYYQDDGYTGFSDYSVVGNEYLEAGFAPYAVAIHIVYFAPDRTLRVKHFVSDTNEDITNPALKYYEAVKKLAEWYYSSDPHPVELTRGLKTFLEHYEAESYPGLGTVKKLSLMHHLELMGRYLSKEN